MNASAEYDGCLSGLNDIRIGRWDSANAIPPARHMNHSSDWMRGYKMAFEEEEGEQ